MRASLSRSVIGPAGQPCGGSKQIDYERKANPLECSGRVRRSSILVRCLLCSARSAGMRW